MLRLKALPVEGGKLKKRIRTPANLHYCTDTKNHSVRMIFIEVQSSGDGAWGFLKGNASRAGRQGRQPIRYFGPLDHDCKIESSRLGQKRFAAHQTRIRCGSCPPFLPEQERNIHASYNYRPLIGFPPRLSTKIAARIPHPSALRAATFPPGEGKGAARIFAVFNKNPGSRGRIFGLQKYEILAMI